MGILGGNADGSRVLVMDRVDVFVEPLGMEQPMSPIEEKVLDDEADEDLYEDGPHGWYVMVCADSQKLEKVGDEDHGKDDQEVVCHDVGKALAHRRHLG